MFLICFLIHESDFEECKTCEGVMTSNARSSRGDTPFCWCTSCMYRIHLYQVSSETIPLLMNLLINWPSVLLWNTSAASFHSNRMLILLLRATCTGHHSFIHLWRSSLVHLYSEYYLLLAHLAYPSKAMVVPPCICSYDTFFSSAISEMCHS